jgi:hypothetical protein
MALLGLVCLSFVAAAADVNGKYVAEVPGRNGTQTTTFNFKTSGDKLEGSITTQRGENPISDGKVSGDTISFVQVLNFNGNEFKMTYTGKVSGDSIEMTRDTGRGEPQKFTAKKQ